MTSEKGMYWMALGVLALAVTNGFVNQYTTWAVRTADRSISMAERALPGYSNLGTPKGENDDLKRLVRAQVRLALVQSTLARHRAEIARAQVEGVRARVLERGMDVIVACPRQNLGTRLTGPLQNLEDDAF
jgi:hypothetical protein